MSHRDPALREILKHVDYVDIDTAPVRTVLAIQGGGSHSRAAASALKVILPHLLAAGSVDAVSGTSGGAVNAALVVKALNEGTGAEGAAKYLDAFWNKVRAKGVPIPRFPDIMTLPEDRWPNIPQGMMMLSDVFATLNPLTRLSLTTASIRDMVDTVIGDWSSVQSGKTAIYTNSVGRNIFTGDEQYEVASGKTMNADAVASSAGLDELGGHLRMSELMNPFKWAAGDIKRYRDGAYRFNPDLETMMSRHRATDVVVVVLHGSKGEAKSPREQKLYTDHILRDLAGMQLDDGRSANIHVIQLNLPGNATSRLNAEPSYLDVLDQLGREQAMEQLPAIVSSLGVRSSYHPSADLVAKMVRDRELVC